MNDMSKIKGYEYFRSLPKERQELIDNVMLSTMDMCSEMTDQPIAFHETAAYQSLKWEMLGHMLNKEYYDHSDKTWKRLNDDRDKQQ